MPGIARIGDIITTGHDCDAVSTIKQGSSNVFVNGLGVVRVGDSDTHEKEEIIEIDEEIEIICVPHTVTVGAGSNKVFVNGRGVARVGDTFSGEPITTGSLNVFAG
jgi:uncharacterized Zn-binding protein involved in type VI secretion